MNSSSNRVQNIKSLINKYFENEEVYTLLQKKVKSENLRLEDLDNERLMEILREINVLDRLMLDLNKLDIEDRPVKGTDKTPTINNKKERTEVTLEAVNYRALALKITKGKAFIQFMTKEDPQKKFILYISFLQQRFISKPAPCVLDPEFDELCIFELIKDDPSLMHPTNLDLGSLSKLDTTIEIIIVLHNEVDKTKSVYATKKIEWRFLLTYGSINLNLELEANEDENKRILGGRGEGGPVKNVIGILQIEMDLLPKGNVQLLPERLLNEQMSKEKKFRDAETLRFYEYSSDWWNDYKMIQKNFDKRAVKIYAENEDGVFKPVTTFVTPLDQLRGIDSPFHAGRFVSLIPFRKKETPGGDKVEVWHKFHTFLAAGSGDHQDHALLLCSMLLGLGLDAYVLYGSSSEGPHMWVLVIKKSEKKHKFTFWESLTGAHFDQKDPKVVSLYRRIGCVFNHKKYFANIQENDMAHQTDLNLSDARCWKKMSEEYLTSLPSGQPQIALMRNETDCVSWEKRIETHIKKAIFNYRKEHSLNAKFDDKLSYLLTTALTNYEHERISGQTFCTEEFQSSIKNYIPENHTFKAFPIQFQTINYKTFFGVLSKAPMCENILSTTGDSVFFAVRAKVVAYPESIFAVWLSIAVRYHSLD